MSVNHYRRRVRLHPRWISSSTPSDAPRSTTWSAKYLSEKRVPLPTTLDIYETNVYNYRCRVQRLPLRRVRLLPLPSPREQLLPTTSRERLLPLHRSECEPSRLNASKLRFRSGVVRIRSSTTVCLLHGLVLLPCGISVCRCLCYRADDATKLKEELDEDLALCVVSF
ncbi:hypothetical protein VPH35_072624 [Triticum aestivum]